MKNIFQLSTFIFNFWIMARYTGPKHRLARKSGINLLDKTSQSLIRRLNVPPGVHGARKGRRRLSEFGQQLKEKQKAKIVYGLLEKQFKNLVSAVQKRKGDTGEMLIGLLETRLDNIVYRLGFAKTRFQARQMVSHGHILINGKKVSIASFQVKEGDIVSLSDKIKKSPLIVSIKEEKVEVLPFLKRKDLQGTLLRRPTKEDIQVPFETQLIIEYYSR